MDNNKFESKVSVMDQWAETLRAELARLITDKHPDIIYHYTDANGLIGLIDSGCIWATHVSRLNDASENLHGFNLVSEHVRANLPIASRPLIEKALLGLQSVDTYVACYSTDSDLLGQWRNYTGTRVGYSLGFETSQMATLDDKMPLLEPIIYNDSMAKAVLDLLVQRVDEFLMKNPFGEIEIGYLSGMVKALLNNIACTIKHHKFEEECEYRHFFRLGDTGLEMEPFFRAGQFGLTPYVKVQFLEKGKLPLKTITVGPCKNFVLESKALEILLGKHGYKGVEIFESEIPLRV